MDDKTLASVTQPLDIAISSVVSDRLKNLAGKAGREQTVYNILKALRSLEGLQQGVMPEYNEWDAIFYSAWYQPVQINLAYTLINKMPVHKNPLARGEGSLYVRDFGCGALAMRFGLALAALDAHPRRAALPQINIFSEDCSQYMTFIGKEIWRAFLQEISKDKKYPELSALRGVCRRMRFEKDAAGAGVRWLTALHVAYEKNHLEVQKALSERVESDLPDLVVVTSHPGNAEYAFSPASHGYSENRSDLDRSEFLLKGEFESINKFRSAVYDNRIVGSGASLSEEDDGFARSYLKRYPTSWTPRSQGTKYSLYIKNQTGNHGNSPI